MAPRPAFPATEILRALAALLLSLLGISLLGLTFETLGMEEPGRAARKALVPLFILVYALGLRGAEGDLLSTAGLRPVQGAWSTVLRGFLAGSVSLLLLDALLLALGARRISLDLPPFPLLGKAAAYLGQALILGLLEESLFRGLLLRRLGKTSGFAGGVVLGSFLFAAAHFLRPPRDWDAAPAWQTGAACLAGLAEILDGRLREFFGLTLVGLVLALLAWRTGRIYLSLGVHAGWVWVRMVHDKTLAEVHPIVDQHPFLLGSKRHYDGLAGWLALGLALFLLSGMGRLRRPARGRVEQRP